MDIWQEHDECFIKKEKDLEKTIIQVTNILNIQYPEPQDKKNKIILKSFAGETFSVNLAKAEAKVDFIFEVNYLQYHKKDGEVWYQPKGTLHLKGLNEAIECFIHGIYSNKFQKVGNLVYGRVTNGKMQLILKKEGDGFTPQE